MTYLLPLLYTYTQSCVMGCKHDSIRKAFSLDFKSLQFQRIQMKGNGNNRKTNMWLGGNALLEHPALNRWCLSQV